MPAVSSTERQGSGERSGRAPRQLFARLTAQTSRPGKPRAASDRERGAVLVEFALVAPLLFLILFGIIEFGFIFKDSQALNNMARAGVRVGAITGDATDPSSDYQILTAILGADAGLSGQIQEVIIFDATPANGNVPEAVPQACLNASPTSNGVSGDCNIYSSTELKTVSQNLTSYDSQMITDFGPTGSGSNVCGPWDAAWCPSQRIVSQSGNSGSGPDYVGIYITALHTNVTGWFGSRTLTDTAVMQLEPQTP